MLLCSIFACVEVPVSCEIVENEKWLKVRGWNARVCRREGKTTHRIQYQHHLDSQKLDTFIKGIESPDCIYYINIYCSNASIFPSLSSDALVISWRILEDKLRKTEALPQYIYNFGKILKNHEKTWKMLKNVKKCWKMLKMLWKKCWKYPDISFQL